MDRIQLTHTPIDAMVFMAEGNPGAANVIGMIMKHGEEIDPDSFMGGFGKILSLDSHRIYGPDIWLFYKDLCGQNIEKMLGAMRAVQLGHKPERWITDAIEAARSPKDRSALDLFHNEIDNAVAKVKQRLPNFGSKVEAA